MAGAQEGPGAEAGQSFALPPLPYGRDSLEPILSAETLEIHHGRHQARYVETLNRLLGEQNFSARTIEDIIRIAASSGATSLFNNAAQAWNHAFFWESMQPAAKGPDGPLNAAISSQFGSPAALGERFIAEGIGHFGSGWVWLVANGDALDVISTHDARTPIVDAETIPLLACDVWEHAYYIDYRQDRAHWLTAWWNSLANWQFAERQYRAALGQGEPWRYPPATERNDHTH